MAKHFSSGRSARWTTSTTSATHCSWTWPRGGGRGGGAGARGLLDGRRHGAGGPARTRPPAAASKVVNPLDLVLILCLGVAGPIIGPLLPGRWAARDNVVEVLHAERRTP